MTLSFNYLLIPFTTYLPFTVLHTFHYFPLSFTAYLYRLMFYLLFSPLSEDQTMAVSSEQKGTNGGEDTIFIPFFNNIYYEVIVPLFYHHFYGVVFYTYIVSNRSNWLYIFCILSTFIDVYVLRFFLLIDIDYFYCVESHKCVHRIKPSWLSASCTI